MIYREGPLSVVRLTLSLQPQTIHLGVNYINSNLPHAACSYIRTASFTTRREWTWVTEADVTEREPSQLPNHIHTEHQSRNETPLSLFLPFFFVNVDVI